MSEADAKRVPGSIGSTGSTRMAKLAREIEARRPVAAKRASGERTMGLWSERSVGMRKGSV